MDFLDPRRMRRNKIQLIAGYVLVTIAIALGTVILVYMAYGYGIKKNGEIIENGLLFVDSKPDNADIYINGELQNSPTSARLVLAAGRYNLEIKRDGYRPWQRQFDLHEHEVARYVYPFLFPQNPKAVNVKSYSDMPSVFTESPDRRWLLVRQSSDSSKVIFDEYDTNNLDRSAKVLTIPSSLVSKGANSKISVIEWSTDNKNVLLEHEYGDTNEFIVFNRDDVSKSFNVNSLFKASPSEVALRDKKVNDLYILTKKDGNIQIGDVSEARLASPILSNVIDFKPYGSNTVNYVVSSHNVKDMVEARIWDGEKSYPVYNFKAGSKYLMGMAEFQNHIYYYVGSNKNGRINVYKDLLEELRNSSVNKITPIFAVSVTNPTDADFSTNARFISLQGGQNFAVYDLEKKDIYRYSLNSSLAAPLQWMDGHRLMGSTKPKDGNNANTIFVMDYDATNQQSLLTTSFSGGGYFSSNFNQLFTLNANGKSSTVLQRIDMRAGADLPN